MHITQEKKEETQKLLKRKVREKQELLIVKIILTPKFYDRLWKITLRKFSRKYNLSTKSNGWVCFRILKQKIERKKLLILMLKKKKKKMSLQTGRTNQMLNFMNKKIPTRNSTLSWNIRILDIRKDIKRLQSENEQKDTHWKDIQSERHWSSK